MVCYHTPKEKERLPKELSGEAAMEGRKKVVHGSSSSSYSPSYSSTSFTAILFDSKQMAPPAPPSSSDDTFYSIFAPPSEVPKRRFPELEVNGTRRYTAERDWNIKPGNAEEYWKDDKTETHGEQKGASYNIYHEQNFKPLELSSSIFYGSREAYSSQTDNHYSPRTPTPTPKMNGNREDGSEGASRGDWWLGMKLETPNSPLYLT
ncbi:hypothetical protein SAY86_029311 [Trapa natans]|uniref:Uncharacterized protein n=1 Tax=Trapa natans TaxID=22666 RepID=A0AAN7RCX6_TRANT|nr:hypothetical protein SAY86_029311 [Trapa natans]